MGFSTGSNIWWAWRTEDTVKVSGPIFGLRNDALYQPLGDASHCGSGPAYAPCWTWTGSAHLDFTRIPVTLMVSSSSPDSAEIGSAVVFTARASDTSIAGMPVDVSGVKWMWVPDPDTTVAPPFMAVANRVCAPLDPACGSASMSAGVDTSTALACYSTANMTCTHVMESSGTMIVTAYVNGEQQQQKKHVSASRRAPRPLRCVTKDSILNSQYVDSILNALWKESKAPRSGPLSARIEAGGYLTRKNGVYGWIRAEGPPLGSCKLRHQLPNPADSVVAWIHTHPIYEKESFVDVCQNESYRKPDGTPLRYEGRVDAPDVGWLQQVVGKIGKSIPAYTIDGDGINKFDTNTVPGTRGIRTARCGY